MLKGEGKETSLLKGSGSFAGEWKGMGGSANPGRGKSITFLKDREGVYREGKSSSWFTEPNGGASGRK